MKHTTTSDPGTHKVRRPALGCKRAPGWEYQRTGKRARRRKGASLRVGRPDPNLSALGGLPSFGAFLDSIGIDEDLRQFAGLKRGLRVVYPMVGQLRLLLDLAVLGAHRVYDVEALAADPVFSFMTGGAVPSVDTVYDDLRRVGPEENEALERVVATHGLALVTTTGPSKLKAVTLDVDTTVTPLFGNQEEALPGPNPRYHGRPSHHPILARIAETDTLVGGRLRPGDRGFGAQDIEDIEMYIDRTRSAVGPDVPITVRIDSAADCAEIMAAIHAKNVTFITKARQTQGLLEAAMHATDWVTVDKDADGKPTRQLTVLDFRREHWPSGRYRVIAVRDSERSGRQVCLWPGLDLSVQFFITNDQTSDPDDVARKYDGRAGIEPLIAELKQRFAVGKVPSADFAGNEAMFLLRLLAYNLMRRWAAARHPQHRTWRASWLRRAYLLVPARLIRSGGRWVLRTAPRPMLN